MQLMRSVDIFTHVYGQEADTSSNYYNNIQPYDKRCFSFCQMRHNFYILFWNYHKFELVTFAR